MEVSKFENLQTNKQTIKFIKLRSRATAKNRRNYVDDALENLENQNKSLTEILEETRHLNQTNEDRLKQIEEDNMHLRQLLDEV